jgi:acyl dehydratase
MILRHLPKQLPVLAQVGTAMLVRSKGEVTRTIGPIDPALVRDYVKHIGGDPRAYRDTVPAHLFPYWSLGLAARTVPATYALHRVLNAGCKLEINAPLPAGERLEVRAALVDIDDDGRRAVLAQRVVTGTRACPDAVVATIRTLVPYGGRGGRGTRSEIPPDAVELARWRLAPNAGLEFAILTGDFNPIHWMKPAAVAAGFARPILHGFAMLARTIEGVVRTRFSGEPKGVQVWDARFLRPLVLPSEVGLYSEGDRAWLGDARGGAPYAAVSFS